jgi:hypothetical protein
VAIICSSQGRITQKNFDRIKEGMSDEQVVAILGGDCKLSGTFVESDGLGLILSWRDGPSYVDGIFRNGKLSSKHLHLATAWEALQWYAKKGAAKIGVKWN